MKITIPDIEFLWLEVGTEEEQTETKRRVLHDLFHWADKHAARLYFDVLPDVRAHLDLPNDGDMGYNSCKWQCAQWYREPSDEGSSNPLPYIRLFADEDGYVCFDDNIDGCRVSWTLHRGGWEAFADGEVKSAYGTGEARLPSDHQRDVAAHKIATQKQTAADSSLGEPRGNTQNGEASANERGNSEKRGAITRHNLWNELLKVAQEVYCQRAAPGPTARRVMAILIERWRGEVRAYDGIVMTRCELAFLAVRFKQDGHQQLQRSVDAVLSSVSLPLPVCPKYGTVMEHAHCLPDCIDCNNLLSCADTMPTRLPKRRKTRTPRRPLPDRLCLERRAGRGAEAPHLEQEGVPGGRHPKARDPLRGRAGRKGGQDR